MKPTGKCTVCSKVKNNVFKINEVVLGIKLFEVISRICGNKFIRNGVSEDVICCAECVAGLIHVDELVTKVRDVFSKIVRSKSTESTNDESDGTTRKEVSNGLISTSAAASNDPFMFSCTVCDFETDKLKFFKRHMLQKHNETILKPYRCGQCALAFTRLDYYKKHNFALHLVKQEHSEAEAEAEDLENNLDFSENYEPTPPTVNDELSELLEFKCPECKFVTQQPKMFRKHMLKVHKTEKGNVFQCVTCDKSYQRYDYYKQHIELAHDSERVAELPCNICNRKFHNKLGLKSHMRVHTAQMAASTDAHSTLHDSAVSSTPLQNTSIALSPVKNVSYQEQKQNSKSLSNKKRSLNAETPPKSAKKYKKDSTLAEQSPKTKKIVNKSVGKRANNSTLPEEEAEQPSQNNVSQSAKTFTCTHCDKTTSSFRKLQRHIFKKHQDDV